MQKLSLFYSALREAPNFLAVYFGLKKKIDITPALAVKTLVVTVEVCFMDTRHQFIAFALQCKLICGSFVCGGLFLADIFLLYFELGAKSSTLTLFLLQIEFCLE